MLYITGIRIERIFLLEKITYKSPVKKKAR